jgi:hypothetical protein
MVLSKNGTVKWYSPEAFRKRRTTKGKRSARKIVLIKIRMLARFSGFTKFGITPSGGGSTGMLARSIGGDNCFTVNHCIMIFRKIRVI